MIFLAVSCGSPPRFEKDALENAMFECHQRNGIQRGVEWSNLSSQDQNVLLRWFSQNPVHGRLCLNTYAPDVVVKTSKFNVNFTGGLVICNYETHSGHWRQLSRKMKDDDKEVVKRITHYFRP